MTLPAEQTEYWRSLEELASTPEFREMMHREFPVAASELPEGVSRRRWLQLMGASLALGGMAGCRYPTETLAPFARRPEDRVPGLPQKFATTIEVAGRPRPLLVTSFDGRPVKVEGNPEHPDSGGATDSFSQALTLELYDPDRSRGFKERVDKQSLSRNWEDVEKLIAKLRSDAVANGGAGLAVLVAPSSSPSRFEMRRRFQQQFPQAVWCEYASVSDENSKSGAELAFGQPVRTLLNFAPAKVVASIDADPLGWHSTSIRNVRGFVANREPESGEMARLYAVESQYSQTGVAADHRLPVRSDRIPGLVSALEKEIRSQLESPVTSLGRVPKKDDAAAYRKHFVKVLASDLVAQQGKSLVVCGPRQPAEVHARVHAINALLGNVGQTIEYIEEPAETRGVGNTSIADLAKQMGAGKVQSLLILGGNPIYDAPAEIDFAKSLSKVPLTLHLSLHDNETSHACRWHLPAAHAFESWGDVRTFDGGLGVSQPLIVPMFGGKSELELLALVAGDDLNDGQAIVRRTLTARQGMAFNEAAWRKAVHDGFIAKTASEVISPALRITENANVAQDDAWLDGEISIANLELVFSPSASTFDGRFANNGWLQELPEPLTKVTWDNVALVSPATAKAIGVKQGSVVRVEVAGQAVELPVYIQPGQAAGSIGVALGYGRTHAGHVGGLASEKISPVGVNVNAIRPAAGYVVSGVKLQDADKTYQVATTQDHNAIDTLGLAEIGRRIGKLVREGTLDAYKEFLAAGVEHKEDHHDEQPHGVVPHDHAHEHDHTHEPATFPPQAGHQPPLVSLWKEPSFDGRVWGMAIDLTKCMGCNACTIACQSENNVPIVGREQVSKNREMHWIRVDRYFAGDVEDPQAVTQPVTCHHCENAPCEQVCPVAATVHSSEGLNDMVYNRCIGTRYCGNNCPYKVRRFNFLDYRANENLNQGYEALPLLGNNPEVTIRNRGVMEKCTYCVQRIQTAKIDAKRDGRILGANEIQTACQQVCAAGAITFGDLSRKDSDVSKAHASPRAYAMLEELNVKPRTKYLARIRNPHPALVAKSASDHDEHAQAAPGATGQVAIATLLQGSNAFPI